MAYVVAARESGPTANDLRSFLRQKLPEYMVPSALVLLDALPLMSNGKVDRRALPAVRPSQARTREQFRHTSHPYRGDAGRDLGCRSSASNE